MNALHYESMLMLGIKETITTNNSDTYDTYKDLYLIEEEREGNLFLGIQAANAATVIIQPKKMLSKTFLVKHSHYLYIFTFSSIQYFLTDLKTI